MASKAPNHLHLYKKVNLSRKQGKEPFFVYKCQIPTCTHYIPLTLAEGKVCECNRCHGIMVITKNTLTRSNGGAMKLPHCEDCTERKNADQISALAGFLDKKG